MSDPAQPTRDELERLRRSVEALERRLIDVEAVLASWAPPPSSMPSMPSQDEPSNAMGYPARAPHARRPPDDAFAPPAPVLPESAAAMPAPAPPPVSPHAGRAEPARPTTMPPVPVATPRPAPTRVVKPSRSIENVIGQNWASWVGAVVLFLGIVFFLKYAWDQGWIRPSPAARVAAAVASGAALAAAGEWLHWRRMRGLAGTLYGAGASVVIASWFGAHAYFDPPVLGATPAFAAVAITAALAILAALHVDVAVVAVIGLLGAYLAPNLLGGAGDPSTFFMTYLAVLALAALAVAHVRPHWVVLRWLALVSTYLWLALWWNATGRRGGHETLAMIAVVGFAALFVLDAAAMLVRVFRRHEMSDVATSTEFLGVRIAAVPLHVHVVLAALCALAGSMLLLLGTSHAAPDARVTRAALALAALLAGPALVLCHLRPEWFLPRWAVLIGSYAWLAAWWANTGRDAGYDALAAAWALALYLVVLLENLFTLRRFGGQPDPQPRTDATPAAARFITIDATVAATSLLSTAGCVGVLIWVWGGTNAVLVGAIAVILALVQAGAALAARSRDYFVSSILQSMALLTLAAPLVLDRFAVTAAWMIMATALALASWQLNLPKARGWAAGLLLLALGRLILFDVRNPTLTAPEFQAFGQPVTRWLMIGWSVALLYHLLAWLRPGAGKWPALEEWIAQHVPAPQPVADTSHTSAPPALRAATVLDYASHVGDALIPGATKSDVDRAGALFAAFGTIVFAAFTLAAWNGALATLGLTAWFAGLLALSVPARRIGYGVQAWVLGMLLSVRWLAFDNLIPLTDTWRTGGGVPAITNLPALCGAVLAAAIVLGIRMLPRAALEPHDEPRAPEDSTRTFLIVWAAAIVFALLNFETIRYVDTAAGIHDRAIVKHVALSVLWALTGFAAIVYGFRRHLAPVRWAALVLLAITLAKILVIDMAEVKAIWRILSFVAVGLLLLCVSFVYHKQVETKAVEEG